MNTVGREVIGKCGYDTLIADASMKTDVVTVTLTANSEEMSLRRGSVLAASDEDGKCSLLNGEPGKTAAYILAEDTVTSKVGETIAVAYQTGKFIRESLIVGADYVLSVGDERALRNAGIYLENGMK